MSTEGPLGYKGGLLRSTRPIWSVLILIAVGVSSALTYPTTHLATFYSTTAQVIVTLYIAIAVETISMGSRARAGLTLEHWIFIVASCAGLLATLRAISVQEVHPWLTGLSTAGVAATVLLVAENLVNWRAGKQLAALWSTLFIGVVVVLLVVIP